MENQRLFVWAALGLVLWLNYIAWQRDYAPVPPPPAAVTATAPTAGAPAESLPELPAADGAPAVPASATAQPEATAATAAAPVIRVVTDVLDMQISTRGGELLRADLLKYPKVKNEPDNPVRLFDTGGNALFVIRSGLRAADQRPEPTHQAQFQASASEYRLQPGESQLVVPLIWTDDQGVTVTKTYTFKPGSYRIDLNYDVDNQSGSDWKAASYVQLIRHYEHVERSYFNVETYAYRGPAIYDGKAYRKLQIDDEDERSYKNTVTGGWVAALQHHFVAAAVPPVAESYDYQLSVDPDNDYILSYRGPLQTIAAGATGNFAETLFVGPKLQEQLETTGPKLELTADYGKLTILSQPLFWLLDKVHGFVKNWGLAIIIVTFLIKLVFYKLTAASGRSMAKMRNVAPRIKAIQERYKDDREQLGRQMMEIYKREKINPLAGCLPILIQIPFFLAFYWVLLESVEMRQAPFFGWITDLSTRDPFFILPILMGAAMFAQFKLQPMPSADPLQAKIFAFMPVIMAATMAWFPAGLVLYWLTNTLLSIAQQWRINKLVAAEGSKKND
ncbi:membrane protein insertase YidC [Povalibacter sp.]|uniref:membrane protein insertase YidC n=1 Tax=Povalibacter sp. TaxID=1962978 RepID=UPI002F3E57E9